MASSTTLRRSSSGSPLVIRAHGPDYYRVASIDDGLGTIAFSSSGSTMRSA